MLVRDYVQFCARCGEVTAHSQRALALPVLASVTCWVVAAGSLALGIAWPVAGVLAFAGLLLFLRDRERRWVTRCNRCRGKQVAAIRRTKPTLDERTEIFLG